MKSLRTFFIIGEFNHFSYHGIDYLQVISLNSNNNQLQYGIFRNILSCRINFYYAFNFTPTYRTRINAECT